ncbi:MAG: hypothetical protein ACHQK9_18215 [Reyranellales bacterium]
MESRRIASTRLDGLKPFGRAAEHDHAQLVAYLSAHPELGKDVGRLFAEPVPARDGGQIDWYVESGRRSIALESLAAERQAALLERVTAQLSAIRREGGRLRDAGNPLGTALIAASETPTPLARYIHVLLADDGGEEGETPVLVCWAYTDDAPRTLGAVPQVMVAAPLPPPFEPEPKAAEFVSAPAVAMRRGFAWWWPLWLLLAILLLTIGWMLLRACGVAWPGLPGHGYLYCRAGAATLAAEVERGRALDDTARRLELQLVQSRIACLAATPPPLPKDRWLGKDLSILAGCWSLGHDTQSLVVNDTGKEERCTVHTGTICFSADGTGTREQTTDCGAKRFSICKSPIKARFNEAGALQTEQPDTKCEPATITWHSNPNRLTCKRVDDGTAICRDDDNFEHEFRRKATP